MDDVAVTNDPVMGFITIGCPVCVSLRAAAQALCEQTEAAEAAGIDPESDDMQGVAHPNLFLAVYAQRSEHEKKTGHTTFGWRFIIEARKQAAEYASDPLTSGFWKAFVERFLVPPPLSA